MIAVLALSAAAVAAPEPISRADGILTTCVGASDRTLEFLYVIWGRPGASEATVWPKSTPPIVAAPAEFSKTAFAVVQAPNKPDGSPNTGDKFVSDSGETVVNGVRVKFTAFAKVEAGKLGDFQFAMKFPNQTINALCGRSRSAAEHKDELK